MGVRYTPDNAGLAALGRSSKLGDAVVKAARTSVQAAAAADDPGGGYETTRATVPSGWRNEPRAGASVKETKRGDGARRRSLVRAAAGGRRK